ncbi:MAG: biosynthetic arginine decarboxylase [SAR324 cluster bacterium]|nr:biosynthetic arginine decarboxylase [SAR324 cluster bacterium]
MTQWTIEDTKKLYHIERWGGGYFDINPKGHLSIFPKNTNGVMSVDIMDVIEEIKKQKIALPAIVRFHDILRSQVVRLNETFIEIIKEAHYQGKFIGVFPIKVNQMREVVEEIIEAGVPYHFGLETGSKSELLSALAFNTSKQALTILNGYKDQEYLKLALLGEKLDRKVVVVIEKFTELKELLALSSEMKSMPWIGFRAKLSAKGTGKWSASGGEKAKFGLTAAEIMEGIRLLKKHRMIKYLTLFHFHIGSQITDIRNFKDAITEGARMYTEMVKQGAPLHYFDVGGGLGVDYDGTKTTQDSSVNYTLEDYVENVVYLMKEICDLEKVPHPHLVSESGRMITAYHSCILTEVFDSGKMINTNYNTDEKGGEHRIVSNMREVFDELNNGYAQEGYHDALQLKTECIQAFKLGVLSLEERAVTEILFWKICNKIQCLTKQMDFIPEELKELDSLLAEQYFCNFSIFQSIPDAWAIDQLLPIVPLHRLNKKPEVLCTLADITCDSDGKIDQFIGDSAPWQELPLHHLTPGDPYYIGIFLTGAYQDVMGDMHNLFGSVNEVHIYCDEKDSSCFYIEDFIPGSSAEQNLATMQYNTHSMISTIKKKLNQQVQKGKLRPKESVLLANFYENCFKNYSYLNLNKQENP